MAHLHLEPNCDWPLALTEARALIRERFAIDHITLQPENADMERQCRWRPKDGCRFCCSRPENSDCPHQRAA